MDLMLTFETAQFLDLCRRHHIRWLALFGSALREDFRPDSDLDILVDFEPEHTPGWAFAEIQEQLSELLDRDVDLHTPRPLSRHFRDEVLASARTVYGQAQPRLRTAVQEAFERTTERYNEALKELGE